MPKTDRILNYFPWYYRATDHTKLLCEVVRLLAQPFEEADTHLFRIQRSHRLKVAEHEKDIMRLAAVLNLTEFHFEDILTDETLDYNQKLDMMRERIQRIARVHMIGLGTPWTVMEAAAIFLNATIVPDRPGDPMIKHIDENSFSHKAVIEFKNLPQFLFSLESEFDPANIISPGLREAFQNHGILLSEDTTVLMGNKVDTWLLDDQKNRRKYLLEKDNNKLNVSLIPRDRIYLHENPVHRKKVDLKERWQMNSWTIENESSDASQIKLVIQGVGEHTVLPCIFCPDTEEGVIFNGIVPDGKMLVIDEVNGALLDNYPVDEWVVYFKGGIFDFSNVNETSFGEEQGDSLIPFDGDFEKIVAPPFRRRKTVPTAPVGRSEWRFKVAEGVYDGNDFDFSVYATNLDEENPDPRNPLPIGIYDHDFNFDNCVFDFPARGIVGMAWDERIPCSFKLLLPPNVPGRQSQNAEPETTSSEGGNGEAKPINYVGWIGNILPRFKAAGVRAFVDTSKDAWILGESVIRNADASDGEGVGLYATRLLNPMTDIFVPLDITT